MEIKGKKINGRRMVVAVAVMIAVVALLSVAVVMLVRGGDPTLEDYLSGEGNAETAKKVKMVNDLQEQYVKGLKITADGDTVIYTVTLPEKQKKSHEKIKKEVEKSFKKNAKMINENMENIAKQYKRASKIKKITIHYVFNNYDGKPLYEKDFEF